MMNRGLRHFTCATMLILSFGVQTAFADEPAPATQEAETADPYEEAEEENNKKHAKEMLESGVKAQKAGDLLRACALFEESNKLFQHPRTQFQLADCWAKLGRLANAHYLMLRVAQAISDKHPDAAKDAVDTAEKLKEAAPCVIINVSESTAKIPDVRVVLDGENLPRQQWNGPCNLVDLSSHTIQVVAPMRWWKAVVVKTLEQKTTRTVDIGPPDILVPEKVVASPHPPTPVVIKTSRFISKQSAVAMLFAGVAVNAGSAALLAASSAKIEKKDSSWDSSDHQAAGVTAGALLMGGSISVVVGAVRLLMGDEAPKKDLRLETAAQR